VKASATPLLARASLRLVLGPRPAQLEIALHDVDDVVDEDTHADEAPAANLTLHREDELADGDRDDHRVLIG
jgi:hypothetical protein